MHFENNTTWLNILTMENLAFRKEIAELKKQLNKKTAPPKGAPVRDIETGAIGYSLGKFHTNGDLLLSRFGNDFDSDFSSSGWEEIEVKLK